MKEYLKKLIEDKGRDFGNVIEVAEEMGHFGFTYEMLADCIETLDHAKKRNIRDKLVKIDFQNGDVFEYLAKIAVNFLSLYNKEVLESEDKARS